MAWASCHSEIPSLNFFLYSWERATSGPCSVLSSFQSSPSFSVRSFSMCSSLNVLKFPPKKHILRTLPRIRSARTSQNNPFATISVDWTNTRTTLTPTALAALQETQIGPRLIIIHRTTPLLFILPTAHQSLFALQNTFFTVLLYSRSLQWSRFPSHPKATTARDG